MSRPIDAYALNNALVSWYNDTEDATEKAVLRRVMQRVVHASTLPQPSNEALTLISMGDELPPDNERVLVYRPCMENADTGPYSVQWGWAAKRDGSHWAHLPDRRPPEGEEDT